MLDVSNLHDETTFKKNIISSLPFQMRYLAQYATIDLLDYLFRW